MGMDYRAIGPKSCQPSEELVKQCNEIAKETGAKITLTDDVDEGLKGVDFIYTDVWVSMGKETESAARLKALAPYQINGRSCTPPSPGRW